MIDDVQRAIDDVLGELDPAAISLLLGATGWRRMSKSYPGSEMWTTDSTHDRPIVLPIDRSFDDYRSLLSGAIRQISEHWELSVDTTLLRLQTSRFDTLRFRSLDGQEHAGTLPLSDGLGFLAGIKEVLVAAAKSARERRSYFGRSLWNVGRQMLADTRLGQTAHGSYVINVHSELSVLEGRSAHGSVLPGHEPPERLFVIGVLRSIEAAVSAAQVADGRDEAFWNSVEEGVSADLCRGLADVAESSPRGVVEVSALLSPLVESPPDVPTVRLESALADRLRYGAVLLKRVEEVDNLVVAGFVERLQRPATQGMGSIVIVAGGGTSVPIGTRIRADLAPEDYSTAVQAHDARAEISLRGQLVIEGTNYRLYSARAASAQGATLTVAVQATLQNDALAVPRDNASDQPGALPRPPE